MSEHSKIPEEELNVFKSLKDIQVVFDVGARADVDYLDIFPDATFHLFEPNPIFFDELASKVGDRENVILNKYGLGDSFGYFSYFHPLQAFSGGEAFNGEGDEVLPIRTLDWYVEEYNIDRIDFLKIDTEGYDFKVLRGGKKAIDIARYIQYEHWDELEQFHKLLGKDFNMKYIGFRNVLCKKKNKRKKLSSLN